MSPDPDDLFELLEPSPEVEPVPLLVDLPHSGTAVPDAILARMTDAASRLPDTDRHLDEIYRRFVPELGGRTLIARYNRYVVDLNRPADGSALYPGRDETRIVPTTTFDNEPIYREAAPDEAEVGERIERYWRPYHARLRDELDALVERFGYALLWDGHSIRGHVPRFSEEPLPDLMLGDVDGTSCPTDVTIGVLDSLTLTWTGSVVLNHLFRGGHITRHYGRHEGRVLALQMEMSQRIYMQESDPFPLDPSGAKLLAHTLAAALRRFVEAGRQWFGAVD